MSEPGGRLNPPAPFTARPAHFWGLLIVLAAATSAGMAGPGLFGWVHGAASAPGSTPDTNAPGTLNVGGPHPSLQPAAGSLTVTLTASRSSVAQNSPVDFTGSVAPASGAPFTLTWTGLPSTCQSGAPGTSPSGSITDTCTPTSAGMLSVSVSASNGTGANGISPTVQVTVYATLSASLTLTPSTLNEANQLTVGYQVNGGVPPYSLTWVGLPNGCSGSAPANVASPGSASFLCNPTQAGSSQVSFRVSDSASPSPNTADAPQQTLQVNSNTGGNGNNQNNGNKSGGNFSIPGLAGIGSLLSLVLIGSILLFVLILITAVSTLVTAILIARRLPPRSAVGTNAATRPCPSCGKAVRVDTKFCPECGRSMSESKPAG